MIVLKNGWILSKVYNDEKRDFKDFFERGKIWINNRKIEKIEFSPSHEESFQKQIIQNEKEGIIEIDCKGSYLLPGFIDMHVHLRDLDQSYKETIKTGTCAAIAGGTTTVIAMPNTQPPLSTTITIDEYIKRINSSACCRVGINIGIKQGFTRDVLDYCKTLKGREEVPFIYGLKIYPGDKSATYPLKWPEEERDEEEKEQFSIVLRKIVEDRNSWIERFPNWKRLMDDCKERGFPLLFHPELPLPKKKEEETFQKYYRELEKTGDSQIGFQNKRLYIHDKLHPIKHNERALVEFIIKHLYAFYPDPAQAPLVHFCHVSSPHVVDLIETFLKREGYSCIVEVTPHHLFLNREQKFPLENYAKVLVPLRSREVQEDLLLLFSQGKTDIIGTDHAPHSKEEKERSFMTAPSGFPSLEWSVNFLLSQAYHGRVPFREVIRTYIEKPAELLSNIKIGKLEKGYIADIICIKHVSPYKLPSFSSFGKSKWNTYGLHTVEFKIEKVFIGGHLIYENGKMLS